MAKLRHNGNAEVEFQDNLNSLASTIS